MAKTMEEMRKALEAKKAQETGSNNQTNQNREFKPKNPQEVNISSINPGETVKIRFVADGDINNDVFWRDYAFHKLFFRGV